MTTMLHAPRRIGAVCFASGAGTPEAGPDLRLGSADAEALVELLQVFACGEESAALAFSHLAARPALATATAQALRTVSQEELGHEELLRGLRAGLPQPLPDFALRRALMRYYAGLGSTDPGRHLTAIAALDSGVCLLLAPLLHPGRPLAEEPAVRAAFSRIRREEAGHVRITRSLAAAMVPAASSWALAEQVRDGLVDLLERRAWALERLHVDPDTLFGRLRRPSPRLFDA